MDLQKNPLSADYPTRHESRNLRIEIMQFLDQKQVTDVESTLRPLMGRIQARWAADSKRTDQSNRLAELTDNQCSTKFPKVAP